MKDNSKAPKVFMSYSHDSEDHVNWVEKLYFNLRSHGVDVILDKYDVQLGDDLPFFMEQGLTSSNLVLCVCSKLYTEKANTIKGGVGYEKMILTADLMRDGNINHIIPIIRNNDGNVLPTFLKGKYHINFNDDSKYFDNYRELLARIHGEDIKSKPPLGTNPFDDSRLSHKISAKIEIERIRYHNPSLNGRVSFDYSNNNHEFTIGKGEYTFITRWSLRGNNSIYCYKDRVKRLGYNPSYTEFPSKDDILNFDFSSRTRYIYVGQIVILENKYHKFAAIKVTKVSCNDNDSNHLLEFEYKIYNDIE